MESLGYHNYRYTTYNITAEENKMYKKFEFEKGSRDRNKK